MQGLLGAIIRTLASTLNELRGHWRAFSREGQFSRVILYVLRVECRGTNKENREELPRWKKSGICGGCGKWLNSRCI